MADQPSDGSEVGTAKFLSAGWHGELIFLLGLAAIMAAIALLIVALTDVEPSRAFPLAFYFGGAVIVVGGFLSAVEKVPYWYPRSVRQEANKMAYIYAVLGVVLIVVGLVLESLL